MIFQIGKGKDSMWIPYSFNMQDETKKDQNSYGFWALSPSHVKWRSWTSRRSWRPYLVALLLKGLQRPWRCLSLASISGFWESQQHNLNKRSLALKALVQKQRLFFFRTQLLLLVFSYSSTSIIQIIKWMKAVSKGGAVCFVC